MIKFRCAPNEIDVAVSVGIGVGVCVCHCVPCIFVDNLSSTRHNFDVAMLYAICIHAFSFVRRQKDREKKISASVRRMSYVVGTFVHCTHISVWTADAGWYAIWSHRTAAIEALKFSPSFFFRLRLLIVSEI